MDNGTTSKLNGTRLWPPLRCTMTVANAEYFPLGLVSGSEPSNLWWRFEWQAKVRPFAHASISRHSRREGLPLHRRTPSFARDLSIASSYVLRVGLTTYLKYQDLLLPPPAACPLRSYPLGRNHTQALDAFTIRPTARVCLYRPRAIGGRQSRAPVSDNIIR